MRKYKGEIIAALQRILPIVHRASINMTLLILLSMNMTLLTVFSNSFLVSA